MGSSPIARFAQQAVCWPAATTFTMTPTTTYLRNGATATFADVKVGDTATITAQEQLPSGVLLACSVSATGA